MAEPLILAYGRGELPEFPAVAGLGARHRALRPRGQRDRRGLRDRARDRRSRSTTTSAPGPGTR